MGKPKPAPKPAPKPKPETKEQRANRQGSQFRGPCGASYATATELGLHVACCQACGAVEL